jgi:hypothetical protein
MVGLNEEGSLAIWFTDLTVVSRVALWTGAYVGDADYAGYLACATVLAWEGRTGVRVFF